MEHRRRLRIRTLALCAALAAAGVAAAPAHAATKKPAKPQPAARPAPPPEATPEQLQAAELVYYGHYDCEFGEVIDITVDTEHRGYVMVGHRKAQYRMKPVLSSTGAVRLEDVKGVTLMVQIASKSMLMDVKAGRRLVDECVSPKQRDLILAAEKAKAAEAAASAAAATAAVSAASAAAAAGPAVTPTAVAPAASAAQR